MTEATGTGVAAPHPARADFEAGVIALAALAAAHGMTRWGLSRLAERQGWLRLGVLPKRSTATSIAKLRELVQSRLQALEAAMGAIGRELNAAGGEREIRELSLLTRTLEKVIELERKHGSSRRRKRAARHIDDARRDELARRLAALGRDGQAAPGGDGAGSGGGGTAAGRLAALGEAGPAAG